MDTSSIDYAEGRVFTFEDESAIRPGFLETIEYSGPRQHVSYQMNEFAAVCPFPVFRTQELSGSTMYLNRNLLNSRH